MIVVLGDAFVDIYHVGKVRSLSAEAPVPVIDITATQQFDGGAGNVARNLQEITKRPVVFKPSNPAASLPLKHRLITEQNTQLARWDEKDYCYPYPPDLNLNPDKVEAVVVSDYGKGSITPEVIEYLISFPGKLFVDTKQDPRPWLAHPEVILFPNLAEYKRFQASYDWFPRVVLKQSENGLAWMEYGQVLISKPSVAKDIVCVNGAGDTVLAAFTVAYLNNQSLPICLEFANRVASVVVGKPFTAVATWEDAYGSAWLI